MPLADGAGPSRGADGAPSTSAAEPVGSVLERKFDSRLLEEYKKDA